MCCYRDIKNFDRFNLIVQSMIFLAISQLKDITILLEQNQTATNVNSNSGHNNNSHNNNNNCVANTSSNSSESTNTAESNSGGEDDGAPNEEFPAKKLVILDTENTDSPQKQPQPQLPRKSSDENVRVEDNWTLGDIEKLLIVISKAFLLNFPLYIAFKHGVHPRMEDISTQEAQVRLNRHFSSK